MTTCGCRVNTGKLTTGTTGAEAINIWSIAYCPLHAAAPALLAALSAVADALDAEQGKWVAVAVPYAPASRERLREWAQQARAAIAAAEEKREPTATKPA